MESANYDNAVNFLYSQLPMFSRTGAPAYKPGLETSLSLAEYFDNPHRKFQSIHIGGTNGKGSTSHMIASVLQSQGYKVGLYTSPHLVDFRERMRINGKMIPRKNVTDFVEKWKSSHYAGKPSFFELTMIMAFNWFAEEKVDIAVIEVGMGGRLDSTNIITPLISVITNISHDHNQFLGNTLEEIAGEKAGIIKNGIPVVIGETQPETEAIFKEKASQTNSEITFADQSPAKFSFIEHPDGWKCQYNDIEFISPLGGEYQKKNIKTVVAAIQGLKKIGMTIEDNALKEGLEKVCSQTGLAGRWMVLKQKPLTIADTGHNTGGLSYNFHQLGKLMEEREDGKLRIVIGFVADKAIDKILTLLPKDAVYYITNAQIPRALPADSLFEKFKEFGLDGKVWANVPAAYEAAIKEASEKDIIFIGGSTFIVADLLSAFKG